MDYIKTLPSEYTLIDKVDMQENKKDSFILNGVSFIIAIMLYILFTAIGLIEFLELTHFLIFMLLMVVNIIVHELIHAIGFKYKTGVSVQYKFHGFAASASVKEGYFSKWHYFRTSLLPFIVLTILYLSLFPLGGIVLTFAALMLVVHIASCTGDYYVALKLLRMPKDCLIKDYGIGMEFYSKQKVE